MSTLHRSIAFSGVDRYATLLLLIGSTAVLSRLLTPAEFGVFAVISAIVTVISASFQEFGGANYLIQKQELSHRCIRTAFTVTFCLSAVVAIAVVSLDGALARFFKDDGLKVGLYVGALNFLLMPFSVTVSALFRRDMQFGNLAICNLVANTVSAAVSIALALLHYGFMAPLWGVVAGNGMLALMLIACHRDISIFRPSVSDCRDVMKFGLYSGGVSVINVFYNLAPQIFLARILDFAAVGLYSRAVSVTQLFDKLVGQVLSPVIMPAILDQKKRGGDLRRIYLDAVTLLTAVHWPFLAFMAIMAKPIILIWLGPTWLEIVPLVRVMCIASLSLFAASLTYPVLVAVGGVRDALISSLISLPPSLLLIFCSSFFGVWYVAASAMLTLPFQAAVAICFIGRHLKIGPLDLIRAAQKSVAITLFTSACALACGLAVEHQLIGLFAGLGIACIAAASSWILGMLIVEHPLLFRLQMAAGSLSWLRLRNSQNISS